ncbi:hypothetical protein [Bradyrhizobium japonicum]|uniref:hypothetical protein n=1 Tax=Bradyrhizobium japonicum TaxID=375 RepID=UPI003211C54A
MASRDAALILVAEGGSPTMFARIGMMRAMNRQKPKSTEAALPLAPALSSNIEIGDHRERGANSQNGHNADN